MFPPEREDKLTRWFEAIALVSFAVVMIVMCLLVIVFALNVSIDIFTDVITVEQYLDSRFGCDET